MDLKEKVENLEKEINRKEKIVQIMEYGYDILMLTDNGRLIKKFFVGNTEIAGGHWDYKDITPDLTKI